MSIEISPKSFFEQPSVADIDVYKRQVLDNIICILFAYCTNRAFVFRSKTHGKAMAREFGAFVTRCV